MKLRTCSLAILLAASAAYSYGQMPAPVKPELAKPAAAKSGSKATVTAAKKSARAPAQPKKPAAVVKRTANANQAKSKMKPSAAKPQPVQANAEATVANAEAPVAKADAPISKKGNKRDPFVNPVVARINGGPNPACSAGKRCLVINEMVLRGIVKSQNGMIAVVENLARKAYFLRENDPVFDGYVVKITGDTVIFKENVLDYVGRPSTREVVKRVNAPAV